MANKYLDENKVNRICVPTGVKNAHPVVQQFVIGANDEPNGHGTIYVNWSSLNELIAGRESDLKVKKLVSFLKLSNIYVGDAVSNLLMVEAILRDKGMSIHQFSQIYKDYPSRMFKVKVHDRSMFKTIKDESRLTEPIELQLFIDKQVKSCDYGRAFVRPSGTEDVLRLYVEAGTYHDVDAIANSILMEIDSKYRVV